MSTALDSRYATAGRGAVSTSVRIFQARLLTPLLSHCCDMWSLRPEFFAEMLKCRTATMCAFISWRWPVSTSIERDDFHCILKIASIPPLVYHHLQHIQSSSHTTTIHNTSTFLTMRFIISLLCLQTVAGMAIESPVSNQLNERDPAADTARNQGLVRAARVVSSRRPKASATSHARTTATTSPVAVVTPTTLRTVQKSSTTQPSTTDASPPAAATPISPSTAPRNGEEQTLCPTGNDSTINDEHKSYWYQIRCGQTQTVDHPLEQTVQPSLKSCIERCSLWNANSAPTTGQGCYGSIFEKATSQCQLFYLTSTSWFADAGFESAATMLG